MADKILRPLYYSADLPGSLRGAQALYDAVVRKYGRAKYSLKQIREWLSAQRAYSLFKQVSVHNRDKFSKVKVFGRNCVWAVDLVDVRNVKEENDNITFLLCCKDVFSRYVFLRPLKTKKGAEVTVALKDIFKEAGTKPEAIWWDRGSEFHNANVSRFLKSQNVKFYSTNSHIKAAPIESFNLTLRMRIAKYTTANSTLRYIDALPDIVKSYNNTCHSVTEFTPAELWNDVTEPPKKIAPHLTVEVESSKQLQAFRNIFEKHNVNFKASRKKPTFKIGDTVRVSLERGKFDRARHHVFSESFFKIINIKPQTEFSPITYKLAEWDKKKKDYSQPLGGVFYSHEIQKVPLPDEYVIDKVGNEKRKGKDGIVRVFVTWKGYPESEGSWIPIKDVHDIKAPYKKR